MQQRWFNPITRYIFLHCIINGFVVDVTRNTNEK